jgi:molybdopterin/thiamine biosynthesis adenylyltransferase
MFSSKHIGMPKVDALRELLAEINPETTGAVKIVPDGYRGERLSGYVFLCVDNIDLRREIATVNKDNLYIRAMFDFRTRLTDAQHYAAELSDTGMVNDFIKSMGFTHVEAVSETPLSACNVALSVAPTVRIICALGVANFINYTKGMTLKRFIQVDASSFALDAF